MSTWMKTQNFLLIFCMAALAITIFCCLVRAIIGPRVTDRIVGINMIGTQVIILIALLATFKGEAYLLDICLIYAMISFLSVVVLTKIYIGVYNERTRARDKRKKQQEQEDTDHA